MRVRALGWTCGLIGASAAISAVALAQSTWGAGAKPAAPPSAPDAGPPSPSYSTWGHAKGTRADTSPEALANAGSADAAASAPGADAETDASSPATADAAADAGTSASESDGGEGDGGWVPSDVGFGIGLRSGYGVPLGMANGSSLYSIAQGIIPIEADAGWFFNPHLYLGGYFLYGFGMGNVLNDECSGLDEECQATLIRFGLAVHYHFRPDTWLDPWAGLGLGYEILNIVQTDTPDATEGLSSALQSVDVTVEAGLDLKPLKYLGAGPYVELATGPYLGIDNFGMHGWLSFGARFRTNL